MSVCLFVFVHLAWGWGSQFEREVDANYVCIPEPDEKKKTTGKTENK